MIDFEKLYLHLFNALTDAAAAVERQDYGTVRDIIVRAQQETEQMFIDAEE